MFSILIAVGMKGHYHREKMKVTAFYLTFSYSIQMGEGEVFSHNLTKMEVWGPHFVFANLIEESPNSAIWLELSGSHFSWTFG